MAEHNTPERGGYLSYLRRNWRTIGASLAVAVVTIWLVFVEHVQ